MLIHLLQIVCVILAVSGMIYLQYRRAKWVVETKDQKADVQTLFSGKK